MGKKIKLIANPIAGGSATKKILLAQHCLEQQAAEVTLFLTSARGDATKAARQCRSDDFDLIIAAGGDGTLNEVISGLAPSTTPVAFLPLGTTNVFAAEIGIPADIEQACQIALHGVPRQICLGRMDGAVFILMAGIGFDAEVVARVSEPLKRWTGKLAYVVSGCFTLLRWHPNTIDIVADDHSEHHGYGAIIGNGRLYGGRFSITTEASLLEDCFHVCLLRKASRLSLLCLAWRVICGRVKQSPDVSFFKARRLQIQGAPLLIQVDGDLLNLNVAPREIKAVWGDVTMMYPSTAGQ